jgi:hypothetical protein
MDVHFPPSPEHAEFDLQQMALRELLMPGPFEPITPIEWRDLRRPQPEITQL